MADTSGAFTTAGTKLGVSATAPATDDAAGWEALTFTDIGDITELGEVGRVYNEVTHNPVGNRKTFKFKGSFNDGNQTAVGAYVPDDAGQAILLTALDSDADFYFALEFNDNPDGLTNTILYYPAKVMSAPKSVGAVDSITTVTYQISINGSILEVAATSA